MGWLATPRKNNMLTLVKVAMGIKAFIHAVRVENAQIDQTMVDVLLAKWYY
jgi:hypothetical protein